MKTEHRQTDGLPHRRPWLRFLILLGALLGLLGCATHPTFPLFTPKAEGPDEWSLAGNWRYQSGTLAPENLYSPEVSDADWPQMTLPANWYLRGLDQSGVVWFRKTVALGPPDGTLARLHFEGVDYACDVWVNGHWVGHHEGYFAPFAFPVTKHLKEGSNLIAVRVNSPHEEYGKAWSLRKRLIKGVLNHHDTRPGGAWSPRGQEKNSGGIWAPVSLRFTRELAITRLAVTPRLTKNGATAQVAVQVSPGDASKKEIRIEARLAPVNAPHGPGQTAEKTIQFTMTGHSATETTLPLEVPNAHLWWPWELGPPALYRLTVTVRKGKTLLDQRSEIFGFREITQDPVTKIWRINGKKIFLRGTNYIASQWLSEMDRQRLSFDLSLMKKAHINAIRVHAHVEPKAFYHLCDEMGLLVWQDFPLQWGYTDAPEFKREAIKQAREMVSSLYNHPSIITWCGHNEPPWDAHWMKWKYPDYTPDQNRSLDEALLQTLKEADPFRHVQKHSATGEHPWLGWYSGHWHDYATPTTLPVISEFGAQALPVRDTLEHFLPPDALWPKTADAWERWRYHNFQKKETFEIAGVAQGETLNTLIHNTQTYQAKLIQLAVESYRRQRFAPVTGIFQFMFVEGWPSMNWGVVDYLRNPKPGYDALKKAYQPLLPGIEMKKDIWPPGETVSANIWIINDLPKDIQGATLIVALRNGQSRLVESRRPLDIEASSAREITDISRSGLPEGDYCIDAAILAPGGKVLALNRLDFRVQKGE
ncbi:glycoside hydrolase family 2 TIM barrel-domain containing protein [Desulfoluna sp.]|uniref:glycoside hydrolase family 2 protein n=1 Tax=Desulfoluna sp. TaxID=2045199 RepID=UPI0026295E16|nr:glycoside hydrolase family 2 TIM barrel-domain containing protein [Desulfoluna sp.]